MIGGIDIHLPTNAGISAIEVAVRAIRQFWRNATFENALTGKRYDFFLQIPFGNIEELFVYRDSAAADLWDEQGAVSCTRNSMIHLLYDEEEITLVVDEQDASINRLVTAIASGLRDEILFVSAELEAA